MSSTQQENSSATTLSLADLPVDVLALIFPYLDARSFLNLTATCKGFYQPSIRLDSLYWRHVTYNTFRLPNRPVVENDGLRWMRLYRRMRTQTRAFTWGSNNRECLGRTRMEPPAEDFSSPPLVGFLPRLHPIRFAQVPRFHSDKLNPSVPKDMLNIKELGIIADLQCGGWSTTLLTSRGSLHSCGVLDGMHWSAETPNALTELTFPPGLSYPQSRDMEEYTKIRQFSSGRSHILGLSDSGRIWSWHAISKPALNIKLLHIDINEGGSEDPALATDATKARGHVRKVVAGWSKSSAYITGTGIVIWDPAKPGDENRGEEDTLLLFEHEIVPRTSFLRPKRQARYADAETNQLGEEVGEVVNWAVLEHCVIFITDLKKVFALDMRLADFSVIVEIPILSQTSKDDPTPCVVDVQGSFRSAAIFKSHGEILIIHQDHLDAWFDQSRLPDLKPIPALQNNNIIQLSFGDYHFLALHSDGSISSYGTELQACGNLGLADIVEAPRDASVPGKALRGLEVVGFSDWRLLPHCYANGRKVWFQEEKHNWIERLGASSNLTTNGNGQGEETTHIVMRDTDARGEVSEWVEQQAKDWDKQEQFRYLDEDDLGAHFALCVAAAGWHSGALMLVNENLERAVGKWYHAEVEKGELARRAHSGSADASQASASQPPSIVNRTLPPVRRNSSGERPRWIPAHEWKEVPEFNMDALRDLL